MSASDGLRRGSESLDDDSGIDSPLSPSPYASPLASPPAALDDKSGRHSAPPPPPSSATSSTGTTNAAPSMTPSSTPLGNVNAARRPVLPQSTLSSRGGLPPDLQAKLNAFHLGRQGTPPINSMRSGQAGSPVVGSPASPSVGPGGIPGNFRLPPGMARPAVPPYNPSPAAAARRPPPPQSSLAAQRGMALPGGGLSGRGPAPTMPQAGAAKKRPGLTLSQMNGGSGAGGGAAAGGPASGGGGQGGGGANGASALLDKYSDFIDKSTGSLTFKGKAKLTNQGVEFEGGKTFKISLDEVDTLDELGKGNYGTVYKVRHSRPRMRRPGLGLAGNKAPPGYQQPATPAAPAGAAAPDAAAGGTSGMIMGMKEIRLELDEAKFAAIIMELDILHRCESPFVIDFYGAFFQEGAVYICMEFMDGGSMDKLYAGGMPEGILRKMAYATTMGLRSLKEEHNIIHRDVKPTNILVNTRGQFKICDFGVSGNLVASIAKTNIGCQSYMAPERISSGGVAQAGANPGGGTYSVQSDIWSLGLTVIECALGQYPYPPETYDNIFSQLSAIVEGEPPDLPADRFSEAARDFVSGCLMKIPKLRPTYPMLLQHAWLAPLALPPTIAEVDEEAAERAAEAGADMDTAAAPAVDAASSAKGDEDVAAWVLAAIERRRSGVVGKTVKPALHAAPMDVVAGSDAPQLAAPLPAGGVDAGA